MAKINDLRAAAAKSKSDEEVSAQEAESLKRQSLILHGEIALLKSQIETQNQSIQDKNQALAQCNRQLMSLKPTLAKMRRDVRNQESEIARLKKSLEKKQAPSGSRNLAGDSTTVSITPSSTV